MVDYYNFIDFAHYFCHENLISHALNKHFGVVFYHASKSFLCPPMSRLTAPFFPSNFANKHNKPPTS